MSFAWASAELQLQQRPQCRYAAMLLLCFAKADAALIQGEGSCTSLFFCMTRAVCLCQAGQCPQWGLQLPQSFQKIVMQFIQFPDRLPSFSSFTPVLESLCRTENSVASEFILSAQMVALRLLLVKELSGVYCRKLCLSKPSSSIGKPSSYVIKTCSCNCNKYCAVIKNCSARYVFFNNEVDSKPTEIKTFSYICLPYFVPSFNIKYVLVLYMVNESSYHSIES